MARPHLTWLLARRLRQQHKGFTSFITKASIAGIALGCAALIVLLSVMNGFTQALQDNILDSIAHGELYSVDNTGIVDAAVMVQSLRQHPNVKQVELTTQSAGMLQSGNGLYSMNLIGIDQVHAHPLARFIHPAEAVEQVLPAIYLSQKVIDQHALTLGQTLQFLLPSEGARNNIHFQAPVVYRAQLAGTLAITGEMGDLLAVTELDALNIALNIKHAAKGLHLFYHEPFAAAQITYDIGYNFPQAVYMSDWTRTHGHLYQDIQLVSVVVYIVLVLVIAVASFNIVSALMMAVKQKQAHIAILKTMGMSQQQIARVFVLHGFINGAVGILSGVVIGVILALTLPDLFHWYEVMSGSTVLIANTYFIDYLPSQLHWRDVGVTVLIASLLTLLASLYPARAAAQIEAAQHLH